MDHNEQTAVPLPEGFDAGVDGPAPARKRGGIRRSVKVFAAGALLLGASAGAVVLGPMMVNAASPSASASTAPAASPGATKPNGHHCDGDHAGPWSSAAPGSSGTSSSTSGA